MNLAILEKVLQNMTYTCQPICFYLMTTIKTKVIIMNFSDSSFSITDSIPEDLRDPFYTDQYDQEHIKPPVIRLMLSGELYCRVYSLILKTEQAACLQSHLSVIQALSRKGIYVVESDGTPVNDEDLSSMPIKMVSGCV